MSSFGPLEVFGIEMEYMIVHADTLDVYPIADRIFKKVAGKATNEVEGGLVHWSNELVRHVVELKNPLPTPHISKLLPAFHSEVKRLWQAVEEEQGFLLPTAMHPWMNPEKETQLWPLEQKSIYETYDRIFKCSGHGWANLQSTHINLSFGEKAEDFGRLHAALRILLPLIPVLTASSPYQEGQRGPYASCRLYHYFKNQKRIPSIIGPIVPEPVWTPADYETQVLQPMYKEIAPFDKDGVLQDDWLNSRAVIPKFDFNRFEIRIMDLQECPRADLSLCWLFISILKLLVEETWMSYEDQKQFSSDQLRGLLMDAALHGDRLILSDNSYLSAFGLSNPKVSGLDLLRYLFSELKPVAEDQALVQGCERILRRGSLSQIMVRHLGNNPSKEDFKNFYQQLSRCLLYDQIYEE